MQYTQYYNFKLPEGTDIVNPLVDNNPNWSSVDTELKNVEYRTIAGATESVSGSVHTITRVASLPFFSFTATGDWKNNDSVVIMPGSMACTPTDTSGNLLKNNTYVTGQRVLCYLSGTTLTMFVNNYKDYNASDILTTDGDSVQDYIDNTKFKNLETWTPNIGENWETFLARIRDNSTKTIPANFIRCTVDGVSGLIFRQSRRTSATSWQYETDYFTGNSLIKYAMSVGSDSAVLRKYDILNGTVQNLSSADAQIINIYGLDV